MTSLQCAAGKGMPRQHALGSSAAGKGAVHCSSSLLLGGMREQQQEQWHGPLAQHAPH